MLLYKSDELSFEQREQLGALMKDWENTVRPVIRRTEYVNEHNLVSTPSILGDDVSVAYYLLGEDTIQENTTAALFLNYNVVEMMKLDNVEGIDSLREHAYDNLASEISFCPLSEMIGVASSPVDIFVLSNESRYYGAAVIELLDRAKPHFLQDKNFYMLPSSIHETLILPTDEFDYGTLEDLNHMVQSVNAAEVSPDEQLADHAYMFDREGLLVKDFDNSYTL